jgi:hypothetical protein
MFGKITKSILSAVPEAVHTHHRVMVDLVPFTQKEVGNMAQLAVFVDGEEVPLGISVPTNGGLGKATAAFKRQFSPDLVEAAVARAIEDRCLKREVRNWVRTVGEPAPEPVELPPYLAEMAEKCRTGIEAELVRFKARARARKISPKRLAVKVWGDHKGTPEKCVALSVISLLVRDKGNRRIVAEALGVPPSVIRYLESGR